MEASEVSNLHDLHTIVQVVENEILEEPIKDEEDMAKTKDIPDKNFDYDGETFTPANIPDFFKTENFQQERPNIPDVFGKLEPFPTQEVPPGFTDMFPELEPVPTQVAVPDEVRRPAEKIIDVPDDIAMTDAELALLNKMIVSDTITESEMAQVENNE